MISLAVYNKDGKEIDSLKVNEVVLGGSVKYALLKQAIVMYHANKRVGTAVTKGRSQIAGSTRKLYKQKGTGNARAGTIRTGHRVGGGVTFEKKVRDFGKSMPKNQRKMAANSAVLAKLLSDNVVVIDQLNFEKPKTKEFVNILGNLKIDRSCLVMINGYDENIYKSVRNVPRIDLMPIAQLNAGDVCNHKKLLFTKEAFLSLLEKE